jgi:sterol desaturase/sphingolipid hydroxylase (fatty acid hydroxylase superfamily)
MLLITMDILNDLFIDIFYQFINPKKRIFVFYLLAAAVIAFLWLYFKKKLDAKRAIIKIFNPKIFFSRSSISDYKIFLVNQLIMILISPILVAQLTIATFLFYFFHSISWLSSGMFSNVSGIIVVMLFTSIHFTLDDFTKFFIHRCMHKWQILWALHKVHHSATTLTPMTVFRTHPLEGIIFSFRGAMTQAITISIFIFFFGDKVNLITVLGANIFSFVFNILGSNLRHSHIGIKYWRWLEYIVISPAQHQVHHSISKKHYDKNFGVAFAFWDWIFGSHHHSEDTEKLVLGVDNHLETDAHNLTNLYFNPILEIIVIFKIRLNKFKNYFQKIFIVRRI